MENIILDTAGTIWLCLTIPFAIHALKLSYELLILSKNKYIGMYLFAIHVIGSLSLIVFLVRGALTWYRIL